MPSICRSPWAAALALALALALACDDPNDTDTDATATSGPESGSGGATDTGSGTGGGGDQVYGDCVGDPNSVDADACADGLLCLPVFKGLASGGGVLHLCSSECAADDECPDPLEGTAGKTCREVDVGLRVCVLVCGAASTCPTGMECAAGVCAWP